MGFFSKFNDSLKKTKESLDNKLNSVFGKNKDLNELIDDIEETLILSDLGMNTSVNICNNLRNRMKQEKDKSENNVKVILRDEMIKILDNVKTDSEQIENTRRVILIVGVNGVR